MGRVLDIVALRSLAAVADYGGFHRAAAALRVSQSAVSQHVRRLEKVLGRPIVERHGRSSVFTPDGQALLTEARRILAAHDEALRRLVGPEWPTITVGATEHAADLMATAATPPHGLVERTDLPVAPPAPLSLRTRPGADPTLTAAVTDGLRRAFTGSR